MTERKTNRKRKMGRPAKLEDQAVTYSVRFPADVAARIEASAAEAGTTASDIIRRLVGNALRHDVRVMNYRRRDEK
jgi:uncharacterized UPF0146 family protein